MYVVSLVFLASPPRNWSQISQQQSPVTFANLIPILLIFFFTDFLPLLRKIRSSFSDFILISVSSLLERSVIPPLHLNGKVCLLTLNTSLFLTVCKSPLITLTANTMINRNAEINCSLMIVLHKMKVLVSTFVLFVLV